MHAAMETGLTDALDPEQLEQIEKCQKFLAPLEQLPNAVHKELRLDIDLGRHKTFGTADRVIVEPTKAHMVDFKFGRLSAPEARDNLQAWAYVVGVFQRFSQVNSVEATFLLPRRDEVTSHTFHRDQLPMMVATLAKLFDEIEADDPERTACKACEYCDKLDTCPAALNAFELVAPRFDGMPALADVETLTPEVVDRYALPLARIVEAWASRVKARAKEQLEAGESMDNHELAVRAGRMTLDGTVNDAWELVQSRLTLDQYMDACDLSIPRLRKAIRAVAARGEKDAAEMSLISDLRSADLVDEGKVTKYIKRK